MNKMRYIFALAMLMFGLTASGQIFDYEDMRYERAFKNNFWNGSKNISGLRQEKISRSFAELYGKYEGGDLRDTWQPEWSWSAGATTASIRHLDKISFAGSFTFEQTEGYGMCGSMFIKPGVYPVDALEFTPGRKSLQTYSFDGGVSYDVTSRWRIGAKMDFESANIAKRKDLRHSNKRLEMTVAPGFMYHRGDIAFGASYIFEKSSETIEAEQVGTSESSYWAFLDKGLMYGVHSVWTGSGIHLQENGVNGFPVSDFGNGIAVQAHWKIFPGVGYHEIFSEIAYMNMQGKIGEKEYVWFNFPGNRIEARLGYSHSGMDIRQNALVKFGWKGIGMDENVLEKVTENGVNTVLNHGSNRILSRSIFTLSPEYEALICEDGEMSAGADFSWTKSMASQMYPYIHEQSLFTYDARVGILTFINNWDIRALLGMRGGKVREKTSIEDEDSGITGEPFRLEEWYERSIGYQTVGKPYVSVAVRYNFLKGMYIEGCLDHLYKGKEAQISRTEVSLKFGYNF